MDAFNYREEITAEGLNFAHEVCEAHSDFDDLEAVLDRYGSKRFAGGSGGQIVCEFPDQFLRDGTKYFDEQHHETFFVLKPAIGQILRTTKRSKSGMKRRERVAQTCLRLSMRGIARTAGCS